MRGIMAMGIAALLAGGLTQASAQSPGQDINGPAVGVGVICNTSEQAAHFVALRVNGTEAHRAMEAVNAAEQDPRACAIAAVAFTRDITVDTRTLGDQLVQIVRINVLAGFNGSGWQRVSGMTQYAVMEGAGESA